MANRLLLGAAGSWRGMKISKPGRNVLNTNNPDDLMFSTDFIGAAITEASGAFLLQDGGIEATFAHGAGTEVMCFTMSGTLGLGYRPLEWTLTRYDDGAYWPAFVCYSDATHVRVRRGAFMSGVNVRGALIAVRP